MTITIKELPGLVERVRRISNEPWFTGGNVAETTAEAADTLESLAAENERLREAVVPLLVFHETGGHEGDGSDERLATIRKALSGGWDS
jgi:hypothetical protein